MFEGGNESGRGGGRGSYNVRMTEERKSFNAMTRCVAVKACRPGASATISCT
jgi:hypothetical protein